MTQFELRQEILAAYQAVGTALGKERTDEMAVPAYLEGGRLSRYVFWRKLDYIVAAARLRPGMRIFDFGCGTGILLPRLAAEGRRVQATDLHPEIATRLARQLNLAGVAFVRAEAWDERVGDGSIDAIIAANVLEHIEDRRSILRAFARKLTPTGRVVISGPTENRLYRLGRWIVGFSGDYHVTNIRHILADADAVGLRRVYLKRYPLPGPACLYQIAAYERP